LILNLDLDQPFPMALLFKPSSWMILCLLPLAAALLNFDLFGSPTLAAYFAYSILAACTTIITCLYLFKDKRLPLVAPQAPLFWFFGLAFFIFLHGSITHTLNLTHYYWLANAALLWGAQCFGEGSRLDEPGGIIPPGGLFRGRVLLYKGIAWLALFESLVVCGQQFDLLSSKDPLYSCTGTWTNPNVTAMFLALAVYAVFQWIDLPAGSPGSSKKNPKALPYLMMSLILVAILFLRCRSAGLVAGLFITGHYWRAIDAWIRNRMRISKQVTVLLIAGIFAAMILWLSFGVKRDSTQGRLRIWETSMQLIVQKPFTGQGFGLFEKQYNLFTANDRLPDNDHVNMPYNDFLELGVEGGLVAVGLWTAFLIVLWRQHLKRGYSVLPILAIVIIQLTNFGFQAIPAFVLFLLYVALPPELFRKETAKKRAIEKRVIEKRVIESARLSDNDTPRLASYRPKQPIAALQTLAIAGLQLVALLLWANQSLLALNFYKRNAITKGSEGTEAIAAYAKLGPVMNNFVSYHMHFGDAYFKLRQYRPALSQYLMGLGTSSDPDLMIKCGYCYQLLHQFDSSQYYFTLVENMLPYKYAPRLALLKLYQQQGDEPMMKMVAEEIVDMPVKVESNEVVNIKSYARQILEKEKP
jgi:O-antigen ligase